MIRDSPKAYGELRKWREEMATAQKKLRKPPVSQGKVQLSCEISKDAHQKLKIFAVKREKSILQVVEGLIFRHCNV